MSVASIVAWFCVSFCLIGVPVGFGSVVRPRLTAAVTLAVVVVLGLALAVQAETGQVSFEIWQNIAAALGGFSGSVTGQYIGLEYDSGPRW
jgi:hypothetical protein